MGYNCFVKVVPALALPFRHRQISSKYPISVILICLLAEGRSQFHRLKIMELFSRPEAPSIVASLLVIPRGWGIGVERERESETERERERERELALPSLLVVDRGGGNGRAKAGGRA